MQAQWKHNSISMRWCCKICRFSSPNQRTLITHYKLKLCHQASHCPLPCIYKDCVCTFRSELSLKKHLTCDHSQCVQASSKFLKATSNVSCDLCNFSEACSVSQYFAHLKTHIKKSQWGASFKTVVSRPVCTALSMLIKVGNITTALWKIFEQTCIKLAFLVIQTLKVQTLKSIQSARIAQQ